MVKRHHNQNSVTITQIIISSLVEIVVQCVSEKTHQIWGAVGLVSSNVAQCS